MPSAEKTSLVFADVSVGEYRTKNGHEVAEHDKGVVDAGGSTAGESQPGRKVENQDGCTATRPQS